MQALYADTGAESSILSTCYQFTKLPTSKKMLHGFVGLVWRQWVNFDRTRSGRGGDGVDKICGSALDVSRNCLNLSLPESCDLKRASLFALWSLNSSCTRSMRESKFIRNGLNTSAELQSILSNYERCRFERNENLSESGQRASWTLVGTRWPTE